MLLLLLLSLERPCCPVYFLLQCVLCLFAMLLMRMPVTYSLNSFDLCELEVVHINVVSHTDEWLPHVHHHMLQWLLTLKAFLVFTLYQLVQLAQIAVKEYCSYNGQGD